MGHPDGRWHLSPVGLARGVLRRAGRGAGAALRGLGAMAVSGTFRPGRRFDEGAVPRAVVVSVYRSRNAAVMGRVVAEAEARGWETRLWALDGVQRSLGAWSIGEGPGSRLALLNNLIGQAPLPAGAWLLVVDDDVLVTRGSLGLFLDVSRRAGLALAQPGHAERSERSFPFVLRMPGSIARLTTFVEVGPVVAIRNDWLDRVLPFPEGFGMGWGLDVLWSDLRRDGARLGIVDLVEMRHLGVTGQDYASDVEKTRLHAMLRARGLGSIREMQSTLEVWRSWRRSPPWEAAASTSGRVAST